MAGRSTAALGAAVALLAAGLVVAAGPAAAGLVVAAGPAAARAPDPEREAFARSAATTYRVTFAARGCAGYGDVMANQVRDDVGESPGRPGVDSIYQAGQAVNPTTEQRTSCEPLPGVRFTLGSGRAKSGALSTVTGPGEPVTTASDTPMLDTTGKAAGSPLAGAVTAVLTEDQVRAAGRRQLWVQGGEPQAPLPTGYSFAVLRCAVDGRAGGNVAWITFPSGVRHVFCFAYYVRGAAATGTMAVRLRTTRPVGYPQRFAFTGSLSQSGSFTLAGDSAEATFVRLSAQPWTVQPTVPAGWKLSDVTCAGGGARTDPTSGRADITLAAGENASCTYTMEPPPAPAGLTLRAFSEGGAGTFGLSVPGPGGPVTQTVKPAGDGSAVTATGGNLSALPPATYQVTVTPPAADAAQWSLAGAVCNGAPATTQGWTLNVTVGGGASTDCVLRVARKQATVALRVVTAGEVAAAAFALVPAATSDPGWSAAATTARANSATPATGDVPASVPFGKYLLLPVPPITSADAAWKLSSLGCQPGASGGPETAALALDLTAAAAAVTCTATYQQVPAIRLRLTVESDGPIPDPAAVEVSCPDGSAGRAVLAARETGPVELPQPLTFAEKALCTVSLAESTTRPRSASLTVQPAPGNAPLALPATVSLDQVGTEYGLAVTLVYDRVGGDDEGGIGPLNAFDLLPVILIGSGLVGVGAVLLLVLVIRRRMGLE